MMFRNNTAHVDLLRPYTRSAPAPDSCARALGEFGDGVDDLLLLLPFPLCFAALRNLYSRRELNVWRRGLRRLRQD